jgi:hypothetical protein
MLQILSLVNNKYVWIGLFLASLLAGSYYGGYVHGHSQFIALQAKDKEDRAAQEQAALATLAEYNKQKKEIQDEAQQEINSMAAALSDLSVRYNKGTTALHMCSAASTKQFSQPTPGPGSSASTGGTQANEESIAIAPEVLSDTLDTAIAAINAELEWRKYARNTGQVQ